MQWCRLNLTEIDAALRTLLEAGSGHGPPDVPGHEPLNEDVLRRLGTGYAYVDALLRDRIEIFRYGATKHLVELNHRVLCGTTPERRASFAKHLRETERKFYDTRPGIAGLLDWYQRNRNRTATRLAAGAFVQVVSAPQLFIEGNRRTAALMASYLLARDGEPPLVVTEGSLAAYMTLTDRCASINRTGLTGMVGATVMTGRLARFFEHGEARFLDLPDGVPAPATAAPSGEA